MLKVLELVAFAKICGWNWGSSEIDVRLTVVTVAEDKGKYLF